MQEDFFEKIVFNKKFKYVTRNYHIAMLPKITANIYTYTYRYRLNFQIELKKKYHQRKPRASTNEQNLNAPE